MVVTNPDGTAGTLADAFTVEEGRAADVWVEIIGPSSAIIGRPSTFYFLYGNRGNIDARDVVLLVRLPLGYNFTVNLPVPNLPHLDLWNRVPLGAEVGSERRVPIWIRSVPPSSSQSFNLRIVASSGGNVTVTAEVIQSKVTVGFSLPLVATSVSYAAMHTTGSAPIPISDFVASLEAWFRVHQDGIQAVPQCFLSAVAASDILGTPLDHDTTALLCDSLAESGSPGPWYGNYCGPGNKPGEPKDDLDRACRDHDKAYDDLHKGGQWDAIKGWGNFDRAQDKVDDALCERAIQFSEASSYLDPLTGRIAKDTIVSIFCDAINEPFELYKALHPARFLAYTSYAKSRSIQVIPPRPRGAAARVVTRMTKSGRMALDSPALLGATCRFPMPSCSKTLIQRQPRLMKSSSPIN